MTKLIILAACALIASASGASIDPSFTRIFKIVGGFEIDIAEVPYQVSLLRYDQHHCGGSIIDKNWILTAAHCTEVPDTSIYAVRIGSSEHASGGQRISVKAIHNHPKYDDNNYQFDFSLLELEEALNFKKSVKSIDLVQSEPADGELSTVSGWGNTQSLEDSNDAWFETLAEERCVFRPNPLELYVSCMYTPSSRRASYAFLNFKLELCSSATVLPLHFACFVPEFGK